MRISLSFGRDARNILAIIFHSVELGRIQYRIAVGEGNTSHLVHVLYYRQVLSSLRLAEKICRGVAAFQVCEKVIVVKAVV
jgi:hypothetical protein